MMSVTGSSFYARTKSLWLSGCVWILTVIACGSTVHAQEIAYVEPPLIDQNPFDLIVLTEEAGGDEVKVVLLPFRELPESRRPGDKLEVVLLKYQDRRYEIAWRSIENILFYEQRIYDEALEKMEQKDFVTAFQNLSFLMKSYPDMPKLDELRQQFIFQSAIDRFNNGELRQTLSALEELRQNSPGFRAASVTAALSRVADSLISEYQQNGQLGAAQTLLNRLEEQYGNTLPVVENWNRRLNQMALSKKDEAESLMRQGDFRGARAALMEMVSIYPDVEDAKELIEDINRQHPMVRVGVMQRSQDLDPTSLIDWPARRSGGLVYQSLFRFLETGGEGGRYGFALGPPARMSDDRKQLVLSIDPAVQSSFTAFELAQQLVQRADPEDPLYDPNWAAIFESVSASTANQLTVQLKRPNVLPHALMQWILPNSSDETGYLPGDYVVEEDTGDEIVFKLREPSQSGQPVEVIEVFYDSPRDAVNDLLQGKIDVLDQLYPADAKRLASQPGIRVGSYALPTTHMLIPVSDHAYLASTKFRRALLYATNREAMLAGELLNSQNLSDGRLVSGPFPLGDGETDPLAYAYNLRVPPVAYNPQLARLLLVMTTQELREMAARQRKEPPSLEKLIIGCPDFEFARVAVQAMIQQWQNIGIEAEMRIQPVSQLLNGECDLAYVNAAMWEPATDIQRLLGGNGVARSDDPFIIQGLERLRGCKNWREVRDAMQDLHQLIDYHLPVLPLWQVTDRFAVAAAVEGLEDKPVSLYQNINGWRLTLGTSRTASR